MGANAFALVTQSSSCVDVQTVTTGLQAVDDTTDLDGASDRSLLDHKFAADVHTFDSDEGTTRTFSGLMGRPGSNTSEGNDCVSFIKLD